MDVAKVKRVLADIEYLFVLPGHGVWAKQLRRIRMQLRAAPHASRTEISGLYDGSGSIEDLVLVRMAPH